MTRAAPPKSGTRLPAVRIGFTAGAIGMLCCVGPTLLALFGIVSAATAISWADTLYGRYAWWFRLAGLAIMVLLVILALRRRGQCSARGARSASRALLITLGAGIAAYAVLYAITTALGAGAK